MSYRSFLSRSIAVTSLLALAVTQPALAAPPSSGVVAQAAPATATPKNARAHARLRIELRRGSYWLGQALPISVTAQFRDVDGVTLEGTPALKSDTIFTSTLGSEPRQATQIIDGAPVLVVTWTGTLTPASAGPLALSVEVPARIRYHDPAPEPVNQLPTPSDDPFEGLDPFDSLNGLMNVDPMDPGGMQQILRHFQRSFEQRLGSERVGKAHDVSLTLKGSAQPLEVKPLPTAGQPPGFSGAVGRFELASALPSAAAQTSEPLTLTVIATGDGDLDRVQLTGVPSSADFKTYPISSKTEPTVAGQKLGRRVFEQVLIPLRPGQLVVPPLELASFDPATGHYTTVATSPLPLTVEGEAASQALVPGAGTKSAPPRAAAARERTLPPPPPSALVPSLKEFALHLAPLGAVWLGALLFRLRSRRKREKTLQRALRRSANQGQPAAFFEAARQLIVCHFARRWQVAEEAVTAAELRTKLGPAAEPLVSALSTADAVRFGRGNLPPSDLGALSSQIEATLKEAHHAPSAS